MRENLSAGFLTRSENNSAVQPQKMARGLKFRIYEVGGFYYIAKTKALISCTVTATAQLICPFVLAYAKNRFSHEVVQIFSVINGQFHLARDVIHILQVLEWLCFKSGMPGNGGGNAEINENSTL